MTLSEFKKRYTGKSVDFDGYYGTQCMDLMLTFNDRNNIISPCQRVLRVFKRVIKSGRSGKVARIKTGKVTRIMESITQKKSRISLENYILMKGALLGKGIELAVLRYIGGLKEEFQNLTSVLDVKKESLWTCLTPGIHIKETWRTGNGYVKNATLLKTAGGNLRREHK